MYAQFKSDPNLKAKVIDCSWDQKIPNNSISDRNWLTEQTYSGKIIVPQSSGICLSNKENVKVEVEVDTEHKQFDVNTENELFRLSYYNPKDTVYYKTNRKLVKKNTNSINNVFSSVMMRSVYPCQTKNWFNNQTRMKTLSDDFMCFRPERQCSTRGTLH